MRVMLGYLGLMALILCSCDDPSVMDDEPAPGTTEPPWTTETTEVDPFGQMPKISRESIDIKAWEAYLDRVSSRPKTEEEACPLSADSAFRLSKYLSETAIESAGWGKSSNELLRIISLSERVLSGDNSKVELLLVHLRSEDTCVRSFALEPLKTYFVHHFKHYGQGFDIRSEPSLVKAIDHPFRYGVPNTPKDVIRAARWKDFVLLDGSQRRVLYTRVSGNQDESKWVEVGPIDRTTKPY